MAPAQDYDVIVVGLGAMGSAAAACLARRGVRVLGVEQFQPAHDRGSSHGESRMIRKAYFEHPAYVPLLERAYELWRALEADTGSELLTVTGGLLLGAPESATVTGGVASAERWGLPYRMLTRRQLTAELPTFSPPRGTVALFEPDAGFIRPEAAVRAQLRLAEAAGAELRFGERVLGLEGRARGGMELRCAGGRYLAERLVLCAGPWTPGLVVTLGLPLPVPLEVERQVLFWFEPDGGIEPYLFDRHPVWIWETGEAAVQLYGFPALAGSAGVKVAFFHGGRSCTPDDVDRAVQPDEVAKITAALRRLLPGVPGRFVQATTCMYTNSPDRHFVIGNLPGAPELIVACGFSGHGFKFAPVVGELLAELATGSTSVELPQELFAPSRTGLG